MALSEKEINSLIQKLRAKYDAWANTHNANWFNRNAFEERFQLALKRRMNLEAFILAEITNFENLKTRYEKKKNETSFSSKVDRIIEEQMARVKKYPSIQFHPRAGYELTHLYGALSEIALYYFPVLWIVVQETSFRQKIHPLEQALADIALPRGSMPPKLIEDHALVLARPIVSELEIEKHKNSLLKEAAFVLHDIIDLCEGVLLVTDDNLAQPIRFDTSFISADRKKELIKIFSQSTGYGAVLTLKQKLEEILADFRLTAFKKNRV